MSQESLGEAMERLLTVMAALRGENGCPWDKRQTHRSLTPYLIEEAYEVIFAIETGGDGELAEELGDLLLQVVFHARLGEERNAFRFEEIARALADKLVHRHPHVFGDEPVESEEELHKVWHRRKMTHRKSALEGIPPGLPALQWAAKVASNAAKSGFDWNGSGEILDKTAEELAEFRREVEMLSGGDGVSRESDQDPKAGEAVRGRMETELGDLFFALVQLSRWYKLDPEAALRKSTRKFIRRFQWMEQSIRDSGKAPDPDKARWWDLWAKAKQRHPG
ncbi:MAG: nucleoside triphosphate pyrophosphohydrolase [Deltaproteobacteria bacterium]|nr:nucleoside triphosphate pyrophosphohydrolase [Deltaproteobacteria bacterium]